MNRNTNKVGNDMCNYEHLTTEDNGIVDIL